MFSSIRFNDLHGMKTKRANVNRKVLKLGPYYLPQFKMYHVTCLGQSRVQNIFDGS